jgi:hypothetical protein
MQFEKDKIIEQLLNNEMVITFNKVNGDERVMTCTLKPELLPPQKVTENKKEPNNLRTLVFTILMLMHGVVLK